METDTYKFEYDGREVSLIELLPEILKPIEDFKVICNECAVELKRLYENIKQTLDDQFVESASKSTISKYENRFGIIPNATDTLDERRFRVLSKLNDVPPYTDAYLENKLNELCGEDNWRIYKDYSSYSLLIELSLESLANTDTVTSLVKQIVPANLNLTVRPYRMRYNELSEYTHDYLSAYTSDQIKYKQIGD